MPPSSGAAVPAAPDLEQQLNEDLLGPLARRGAIARRIRLWAWIGPLLCMVLGGGLRVWDLHEPHQLVFDETYYVKHAWSLAEWGYERDKPEGMEEPDEHFTTGNWETVYVDEADFVVHPPVGKWVIAAGEVAFGIESSFGWRVGVWVLGTLSILIIGRVAWELFGSATLATLASFLAMLEGHHFVHSRTGLLDIVLMFFVLVGFWLLLLDRTASRRVLARKVADLYGGDRWRWGIRRPVVGMVYGPWLGLRPYRWLAGISLGLAAGVKWSGLYALAAFGLMTVLWDVMARKRAGVSQPWSAGLVLRDGPFAFVAVCGAALVAYTASWVGWFRSSGGYLRQWAVENPGEGVQWLPAPLRSLWEYHVRMYEFHLGLTSDHTYRSSPWSWPLQLRPTSFFYESKGLGEAGCEVEKCSKAINSVGSVSIWWAATLAFFVLLFWWVSQRDWRAGAIVVGILSGWLPWLPVQHRTIYQFYSIAFEPFMVLAVVFVIGLALRHRWGIWAVGTYLVLVVLNFWYFWPVWTAQVIPYSEWRDRMWFASWI